jgi:hypothetical protein
MTATELLENLTELYAQRDLLAIDHKRAATEAMPPEVRQILDDIDAEYSPKEAAVSEKIQELEDAVKTEVLTAGATVKGGSLQAVYSKPRVTWETKGLEGLIIVVPELAQFRKVGQPSVSIRKI